MYLKYCKLTETIPFSAFSEGCFHEIFFRVGLRRIYPGSLSLSSPFSLGGEGGSLLRTYFTYAQPSN